MTRRTRGPAIMSGRSWATVAGTNGAISPPTWREGRVGTFQHQEAGERSLLLLRQQPLSVFAVHTHVDKRTKK